MTPEEAGTLNLGDHVRFTRWLHRRSRWQDHVNAKRWEPEAYPGQPEPTPKRGIVIGLRTLSDGHTEWGAPDEPVAYVGDRSFLAVLVGYHRRRKPILVLPEHLTRIEPDHA